MITTEPTLLAPDPDTLIVSYHPRHADDDCVSVQFDDPNRGRFMVVLTPDTVDYLSRLFATAINSPRIGAIADQMRAAQRERRE